MSYTPPARDARPLLDRLAESQKWTVSGSPGDSRSAPKASATVRRLAVEGLPPVSVPATVVADETSGSQPLGLLSMTTPMDGLTPLPVAASAPTPGDRVLMAAPSSEDFDAAAPAVSMVQGTVAKQGDIGFDLSIHAASKDIGTAILTPEGLVIGVMESASEPWTTLPAELRAFVEANGGETISAYPEPADESSSMWLWLGPVIGVAALVVVGAVTVVVVRSRRKKALAATMAGSPFAGAPFGGPPVGQAPLTGPASQHGGQPPQYGHPGPGYQQRLQPFGQQPPAPSHGAPYHAPPPAAPGSYDQTQIGQRPPEPPR